MTKNEQAILRGIRNGDDAIWRKFYSNNYNLVKQYILKNSGTPEQVKDLYQDAMMALYKNIQKPNFELTSQLSTYFFSIAQNLWLKNLRATKRHKTVSEKLNDLPDELVNDKAELEQQIIHIMDKVYQIGEPCAGLLKAYYFLKKSMKEIALEFNYSNDKTAKAQKYKCVKRLRVLAFQK